MADFKVSLAQGESSSVYDGPIADVSFNPDTGVLAVVCSDSRIILTNTESEHRRSTVRMDVDFISKVEWISHYEFVAAGSGGGLHYYSIMDMRSGCFPAHSCSVAAMKREGNLLFTGSVEGNVGAWDFRKKETVASIQHSVRNRSQPIKAVEVHGNYLYSSTIYQGRIWAWDLRNTSRKLSSIETKHCQNCLRFANGNLYSISDSGVLKLSSPLSSYEFLYRKANSQTNTKSCAVFNQRYSSLIWTDRDAIYHTRLDGEPDDGCNAIEVGEFEMKDVVGIVQYKSDQMFAFTESGVVSRLGVLYELERHVLS